LAIGFNRPAIAGKELEYIRQALENAHISGDGVFTRRCHAWLESQLGVPKALLTHSCTAALEMAAILCDLGPGDEVIMPSYTFVSTANAVVLRGATPVFVDIRADTQNIDEELIEAAITRRTRAIFVVHYAGVACEMDSIMAVAERHGLIVVEDAAQALMARYRGKALGGIGHLAAISFHETKNLISGEGGALIVNHPEFMARAEIIREKGTNRSSFFRGETDKYTWMDIGSSFLPGDMVAAFLLAQFESADAFLAQRLALWRHYHAAFAELEADGRVRRPVTPQDCDANGHLYYLLLPDLARRTALIEALRKQDIAAPFHYVPLHSAPAGRRFGRIHGTLPVTESHADRLVRLPLWYGMGERQQTVVDAVHRFFGQGKARR
jgi:dTDP-4-amino-4,6-dideoxygalactose transaminase